MYLNEKRKFQTNFHDRGEDKVISALVQLHRFSMPTQ